MSSKARPIESFGKHRKLLISVEDYQRMGQAGIFADKPRVELIAGEIYARSPFSPDHNGHVDKISRFFHQLVSEKALVRTQGSIRIDDYSEPEPDIALLRLHDRFYSDSQATAQDVYLLIEVAITTASTDRQLKLPRYAAAGIPEYWIVLPQSGTIEVYRSPHGNTYTEQEIFGQTDQWSSTALGLTIKGSDLLI